MVFPVDMSLHKKSKRFDIAFDDGHDSGIYSWEYLHDIGTRRDELWEGYLQQLKDAGASRDPADPANVPFMPKPKATCPSKQHG